MKNYFESTVPVPRRGWVIIIVLGALLAAASVAAGMAMAPEREDTVSYTHLSSTSLKRENLSLFFSCSSGPSPASLLVTVPSSVTCLLYTSYRRGMQ